MIEKIHYNIDNLSGREFTDAKFKSLAWERWFSVNCLPRLGKEDASAASMKFKICQENYYFK